MHPDAVPLPQHPHNLESLGESGNPGSLGCLKSGEGCGVVSQSVNHGGSAATDYVQGGQLFRQQDGVVERQEEQGQQLHIAADGRKTGYGRQYLHVVVAGQVVISQGEGIESQLGHQFDFFNQVLHDCSAVLGHGIAGR